MSLSLFYISDLHNEKYRSASKGKVSAPLLELTFQPDIIVLAGDIDEGEHSVRYANKLSDKYDCPVIVVPGNHEYWGHKYPSMLDKLRLAAGENVYVLNNDTVELLGVRFIGATLWTDGQLFGKERQSEVISHIQPRDHYDEGMRDYLKIRRSDRHGFPKLRTMDAFALHHESLKFIKAELEKPFDGLTVVVSHHAPSIQSIEETSRSDLFSAAYASDLEAVIHQYQPYLWIHGHIHTKVIYKLGESTVSSNPGGGPETNHIAEKAKGIELPCRKLLKPKR